MKININGKVDWRIICWGLTCITGLEIYALSQGINGVLLTIVIGIIAAGIGVAVPKEKIIRS